jgi:hypothetical protein
VDLKAQGCSAARIAATTGFDVTAVRNKLRLHEKLAPTLMEALKDERLSETVALSLLTYNCAEQERLWDDLQAGREPRRRIDGTRWLAAVAEAAARVPSARRKLVLELLEALATRGPRTR